MKWSNLPTTALTLVLEKLPLKQRVGQQTSCALVNVEWCNASAVACSTVVLDYCSDIASFKEWLLHHGKYIEHLHVYGSAPGPITSIPCPKLQSLGIRNCSVDLSPGSQLFQDITAATKLTRLDLQDIIFQNGEPDFAAIVEALLNLSSLALDHMEIEGELLQKPTARLLSAQHNSHNGSRRFDDEGFKLLSKYTKLQDLTLHTVRDVTPAGLDILCGSLPDLQHLYLAGLTMNISSSTVPSTSKWTSLKHLGLSFVGVTATQRGCIDFALLGGLTQLTSLHLLQPCLVGGHEAAQKLLSVLDNLKQLANFHLHGNTNIQYCTAEAYANLTASTVLQALCMDFHLRIRPGPNPSAWQRAFPDTKLLPQLTSLGLDGAFPCDSRGLCSITRSCPALEDLRIRAPDPVLPSFFSRMDLGFDLGHGLGRLSPLDDSDEDDVFFPRFSFGVGLLEDNTRDAAAAPSRPPPQPRPPNIDLTVLAELTNLKRLCIRGASDGVAEALVQLSGLQDLQHVRLPISGMTEAGLRRLTALTQLTYLSISMDQSSYMYTYGLRAKLQQFTEAGAASNLLPEAGSDETYVLKNKAHAGSPPDVGEQLLACLYP